MTLQKPLSSILLNFYFSFGLLYLLLIQLIQYMPTDSWKPQVSDRNETGDWLIAAG